MATTIQNVLDSENLTGLTREVIGGIPSDLIPPGFLASTESVTGNTAKYDKVSTTRQSARIVHYGAPSVKRNLQGISSQPVNLLHSFQHQTHSAATLVNLRSEGDAAKQMKGQQTVARQVAQFGSEGANLRMSAMYSLLSKGAIYVKADGSLLASSSGAAYTIDFGVPAGNKGTLSVDGGSPILDANWKTAATDIGLQIQNLQVAARKFTGYAIKHAFYGSEVASYIRTNTIAIDAMAGSTRLSEEKFNSNEIPDGLFGLTWHPVSQAFFELADGTATDWFAANAVTFTPDPSPEWIDTIEGSYLVPTDLAIGSDASAMLNNLQEMFGPFSYAELTTDPPGIKHYMGDTFLPVLKVPKAIFIAAVPITG
jgi:hypothetical protein